MHAIRHITRPTQDIIERYREARFDPATIYEASGKHGMLDPAIKAAWSGARVCGAVVTVDCPPRDNLMLHKAVTLAQPGDILVATIGGDVSAGAWGEVLTIAAQTRGIQGLIIDGAVRDIEAIAGLGFPIFSRGLAIGSCSKTELGRVNHVINCGGLRINPGDIAVGDADGVVIVSQERAEEVLEAALQRQNFEETLFKELRDGKTTLELLGLNEVLERKGFKEA